MIKIKIGYHLGATSCLISILSSNEKLLLIIHNPENELTNYSKIITDSKRGSPAMYKSSYKSQSNGSMIDFFLERYEVKIFDLNIFN